MSSLFFYGFTTILVEDISNVQWYDTSKLRPNDIILNVMKIELYFFSVVGKLELVSRSPDLT